MTAEPPIDQLKALAHPLRFRILEALCRAELNVGEIEDATSIGQPALSQQLAVLRNAGLVETRKAAKLVFYKLASQELQVVGKAVNRLAAPAGVSPEKVRTPTPGAAHFARVSGVIDS